MVFASADKRSGDVDSHGALQDISPCRELAAPAMLCEKRAADGNLASYVHRVRVGPPEVGASRVRLMSAATRDRKGAMALLGANHGRRRVWSRSRVCCLCRGAGVEPSPNQHGQIKAAVAIRRGERFPRGRGRAPGEVSSERSEDQTRPRLARRPSRPSPSSASAEEVGSGTVPTAVASGKPAGFSPTKSKARAESKAWSPQLTTPNSR